MHDMQRGTFSNLCSQMPSTAVVVVVTTETSCLNDSVQFNVMNQDAANVDATPPPSLFHLLVYFLAFQLAA